MTATELVTDAATAAQVLGNAGLDGLMIEFGVGIDCSRSMRDEHGLDKQGQPDPHGENLMQRAVNWSLALAQASDPNGIAQGVCFSSIARLGAPIRLDNHQDWLAQNRLLPEEMNTTNMVEMFTTLLDAAAQELNVPALRTLAEYANRSLTASDPAKRSLTPPKVIPLPRPYVMVIFTDGDPDDYERTEALLRACSLTAVRVVMVYISNQKAGIAPLRSLTKIHGRYTDNVQLVDLSTYTGGLRGIATETFMRLVVDGLSGWHKEVTAKRMLAVS